MKVLYWILFGITGLLAFAAIFSFAIGIAFNAELWLGRARRFGRWLWLLVLFSFNSWVWGSVAYTLIHWRTG